MLNAYFVLIILGELKMKHNLLNKLTLLLILVSIINGPLKANKTILQLKGIIEAPITIKDVPEFVVRFQGKQTISKNDGIFSFLLNKKDPKNAFTLLICEEIVESKKKTLKNKESKNTIKNFLVNISKPYKLYELDIESEYFGWAQKELPEIPNNKNFAKIPQNTIILLANPKIVERVELWTILISPNYVPGPKIILNKNYSAKELKEASERSLAKGIQSACYFENSQINILPSNTKSKISVPQTRA